MWSISRGKGLARDVARAFLRAARLPLLLPLMLMEGGGVSNLAEIRRKLEDRAFRLYCLMLYSDLDKPFLSFVNDTRGAISMMSGESVFVFWFEHLKEDFKLLLPSLTEVDDSLSRNHALKVAQMLGIPNSKLPCLVFFKELESTSIVVYSFDNGWGFEHMGEHMKAVFDAVTTSLTEWTHTEDERLLRSCESKFKRIRVRKWVKRISSRQSLETLLKTVATGASLA